MNILIQNILVLLVFSVAVGFLIKKFFYKPSVVMPKKKTLDSCGKSNCGCH